jgi:uncharacterized protein YpuA (DUF1002 family)
MRKGVWIAALALALSAAALMAQVPEEQKELTRDVIKAEKKLLVSSNMELTKDEAATFWPVYDEYQKELLRLDDRLEKLVRDYARDYKTLSDELARTLLNEAMAIRDERLRAEKTFLPRFEKTLPPKKVARYYQIENKLNAVVAFDLARGIPLAR